MKAKEADINFNIIYRRIKIFNYLFNSINSNIIEEADVMACESFLVGYHFVLNIIFPRTSIKHTNPLYGKVVSSYGHSNTI